MNSEVVRIEVLDVFPTQQQTFAIFVGNSDKCFVIHVEPSVGRAIAMSLREQKSERPLTHELMGYIFQAFGIKVDRVVINALRSNTYFARIILRAQNEVHKKVIEIDARPSDCLAIGLQSKAPIYVSSDVWDEVDDRAEELEKIRQQLRDKPSGSAPSPEDSDPDFGEDI